MQNEIKNTQTILIYHDFRGMAQILRYILHYLQIPYQQILLGKGETVLSKKFNFNIKINEQPELPCLIYGDNLIQDCFSSIHHICEKNNGIHLFGNTVEERALIRDIQYNFLIRKKKAIKIFFHFAEHVAHCPDKKQAIRKQALIKSLNTSGCTLQLIQMRLRDPHRKYLLDHITILDFMFYQQCFYHVNLFGNLEQKNCAILETLNSIFGTNWQKQKQDTVTSNYLKIMRQFKYRFQLENFYLNNKEKLQSYGVMCKAMKENSRNAFKQVWLGQKHFLS